MAMTITDKRVELKYKFWELNPGDVFIHNGDVHVKIDAINDHCYQRKNAVNLNASCVVKIPDDVVVLEVDAELIIT